MTCSPIRHSFCVVLTLVAVGAVGFAANRASSTQISSTQVAVVNASFETPYNYVSENNGQISGYVANGWIDSSSWADVNVVYSQETTNAHSGKACQKIEVKSVTSGEVQLYQQFKLQAGTVYTASGWFRGEAGTRVICGFRRRRAPYIWLAEAYTIPLTTTWQKITVRGYVTAAVPATLMVAAETPGTIWVDDMEMSYAPGAFTTSPNVGTISPSFFGMHVANFLEGTTSNVGFEAPYMPVGAGAINGAIAQGWYDNSSWANVNVTYSEDTSDPHSGGADQVVNVQGVTSGAVQLVQALTVVPGQKYTMAAWVRGGSGGGSGGNVNMLIQNQNPPYNHYAYQTVALTGSWQQVTIAGTIGDTGQVLLMFQGTQPVVFAVDDVTFTGPDGKPVSGGVPWPTEPVGTLRLWDSTTAWTNLEPVKGQWNWAGLDAWVAAAQANGVKRHHFDAGADAGVGVIGAGHRELLRRGSAGASEEHAGLARLHYGGGAEI